jgi:hypothetical protein
MQVAGVSELEDGTALRWDGVELGVVVVVVWWW